MPHGFRPQNLNDAFLAAANQARQKAPSLTHNQEVGSFLPFFGAAPTKK
jgi:hypothetical protein